MVEPMDVWTVALLVAWKDDAMVDSTAEQMVALMAALLVLRMAVSMAAMRVGKKAVK